jgi:hypothetical protein
MVWEAFGPGFLNPQVWNTIMLRTLSLAAFAAVSAAALALPAAAETTLKVDVNGLAPAAVHAKIVQAARAACRVELRNSTTPDQYFQQAGCISDAVAGAEAQLKTMRAANGGGSVVAGR